MIIEEVEVHKILGCESLALKFNNRRRSSVYVVQNNDDTKMHHLLTMAVQLICSAKYAHSSSFKGTEFDNVHDGSVRMKFILPLAPGRRSSDAINILIPMDTRNEYNKDNNDETDSGAGGDEAHIDEFVDVVTINDQRLTERHGIESENDEEILDYGPSTSEAARKRLHELRNRRIKRARCHYLTKTDDMVQKFLLINAIRDFCSNPNEISYSINDGPKERSSLAIFHGRFFICLDYMLPQLENLIIDFNGDWLELLTSDLNDKWNRREQFGDPFERLVHLYHKYGYPEQHILSKITRAHLSNLNAMEALHKTYIIKILRDTRGLFEFISAGEYTVWFYVPHYGRFADVVIDVKVEDLNFEYMTTYIQDNSKLINNKYFWTDVPAAIKDMLLIAFQISLGFHCKQQIIYLSNFDEILKYQAIQFANTSCFTKIGNKAWTSKNYLQRIIDVCIKSGSTAIIEYPGGIPLHPVNAYLMKSYKIVLANSKPSFILKIINGTKYSYEYFLECLTEGLKNFLKVPIDY